MDGLFTLLCLSFLMAVVSFVVGSLPLTFSLSSSQLRLISALGMGVLVGTSLIVIIPEGVETLYSSTETSPSHHLRKRGIAPSGIDVRWQHSSAPAVLPRAKRGDLDVPTVSARVTERSPTESGTPPTDDKEDKKDGKPDDKPSEGAPEKTKEKHSPHAWIGVGLVSGFVLMYLVDQLPQHIVPSSKQQSRPYHISLDNLGSGLGRSLSSPGAGGGLLDLPNNAKGRQSIATTTGLVIHAASDGIALGASTSNTSLSFIIFLAIMVHKAPASFGLTSILLKQGLSTRAARGHLLVFSLATPVGAFLTWLVAHTILAGHASDEQATKWRTGMLLLFSAGTFLYVAMHTMQDNALEAPRRDSNTNGYLDGRESAPRPKRSMRDLIASVIGMIIPLFLQIGHV